MNTAILLSLLIRSAIAAPPTTAPPSLVEPSSNTWAVVHAGQLWICWAPGPDCFERIVFDDVPRERSDDDSSDPDDPDDPDEELVEFSGASRLDLDLDDWRVGFAGSAGLWIERGDQRWRVLAGQRRALPVEDPAPVRLHRATPPGCGPEAMVPAVIGGRLSWRDAPRCTAETGTTLCVPPIGPRLRSPTPMTVRAGLELVGTRGWTAPDPSQVRQQSGVELLFVVELGFDLQRQQANQRARAMLSNRERSQPRELPPIEPGPLAPAERDALTQILCARGRR